MTPRHASISCIVAAVVSILAACFPESQAAARRRFFRMDTVVNVTAVLDRYDKKTQRDLWDGLDSLLDDMEQRFCVTGPRSEIRRLNERDSAAIDVSPRLAEMLHYALRYGDTLDGRFDATILPVKEAWGFGEQDSAPRVPSQPELRAALERVSYKKVRLDTETGAVRFDDSLTRIDVGGIAKGFVLREIARYLEDRECRAFLVEAGGDVFVKGRKSDGQRWKIGIRHPRQADSLCAVVFLDGGSLVTSGDYERFFIHDGARHHHIFDTRTGTSRGVNRSVTIVSPDPVEADILSTGLFCLPGDSIVSFVEKRPHLQCIVVDSMGNIAISPGWSGDVRVF